METQGGRRGEREGEREREDKIKRGQKRPRAADPKASGAEQQKKKTLLLLLLLLHGNQIHLGY